MSRTYIPGIPRQLDKLGTLVTELSERELLWHNTLGMGSQVPRNLADSFGRDHRATSSGFDIGEQRNDEESLFGTVQELILVPFSGILHVRRT